MRTGANFWFTLFLLALLAYGLWSVSNFPTAEARQFPTVALRQVPPGGPNLVFDEVEIVE